MNTSKFALAAAAFACFAAWPAAAQEVIVDTDEDVAVERRVMVIETEGEDGASTETRKVRVVRLREGASAAEIERQLEDMENVDVRIVKMGEGVEMSEEEIRALATKRVEDREMVVFSAREMECEKQDTGEVRLKVCTDKGRDSVLKALREARASVAGNTTIGDTQRARALEALDARIAELEAASER